MASDTPLSVGAGCVVIIILSFLFAAGMIGMTWVLKRYHGEIQTTEYFSVAGRSVKTGLVATAVVSSWTWAATLLQSSGVAYRYGVSGPFWYASGATIQILLFAVLAIEIKRRAPNAHTVLEMIRVRYDKGPRKRWGKATHLVYFAFAMLTNVLVTAMLLTGSAAVVNALTGLPSAVTCFIVPVGVVLYTTFGGIKATFLTDFVHTIIILLIIIVFSITVYATSDKLGSFSTVYSLLAEAAKRHPVGGNTDGSYLTMHSYGGVLFFVINIVGNFGTVFCDAGYYQKAIAADPASALRGYLVGGLAWFSIPWLCATTMGLAAIALETDPAFPSYPNSLSEAQISAGLVLPYAAVTLLGTGGAIATLLLVFMAVTSAMSAELIAVSTVWTHDIYYVYINPQATDRTLVSTAHYSIVLFAFFMTGLSTILSFAGISMGYLYVVMGILISSAVLPIILAITWKRMNCYAAVLSPVLGFIVSVTSWLVAAKREFGALTVSSTGSNNPVLIGNLVALLSPAFFVGVLTALEPDNEDFQSMRQIQLIDDQLSDSAGNGAHQRSRHGPNSLIREELIETENQLSQASRVAKLLVLALTLGFLILWPMPLYGTGYIFSPTFFTGWVVVGILWTWISFLGVGLLPLWEGRYVIRDVTCAVWNDIWGSGQRRGVREIAGTALDLPERIRDSVSK